jgi:hypothetical protein
MSDSKIFTMLHYNLHMSVQGGRAAYDLRVVCNAKHYSLNRLSKEQSEIELNKLMDFAKSNGFQIKKHEGYQINIAYDHDFRTNPQTEPNLIVPRALVVSG